jgi:hypothetical protein
MNGWMNGMSSDRFSPNGTLTRGQAAAVLVRMLGLTPEKDAIYAFSDCSNHWAEAYIDTARKNGIITGIGDNRFEPDRAVSRQEMAVMLKNMLNINDGGTSIFNDLSETENAWSYKAVTALADAGIINGYPDGSFRPENSITRAEAAAVFSRLSLS